MTSGLPRALLWALALPLVLTFTTWLVAVERLGTPLPSVLVLGDSNVANYRILPGDRFEDKLGERLGSGWVVRNWGEVGADPADQYLTLCKAELLRWKPGVVVVVLSPHAFIPDTTNAGHRFRENGDGLRWLPWNEEGWRFFLTLTAKERESSVVRSLDRLFGFYDGYLALRLHSDWPAFRAQKAKDDPRQHAANVADYSERISKYLDSHVRVEDYADFAARPGARDFAFLASALAARGTPLVVAVLPAGDPVTFERYFSAKTRATLENSYEFTLRLLREHKIPYVDFNSPTERLRFDTTQYGDHYHLKTAGAYRHMADGIAAWIAEHGTRRGS